MAERVLEGYWIDVKDLMGFGCLILYYFSFPSASSFRSVSFFVSDLWGKGPACFKCRSFFTCRL